ncbi:hypothetical protein P8452_37379 [Trifolium repens]|nr:hypothetical protein P8452_37379 [Trifolium repens]
MVDYELLITTTTPPLRAYHKFYHYVSLNVENIFQGRTFIYGSVEAVDKREIKFNNHILSDSLMPKSNLKNLVIPYVSSITKRHDLILTTL